MCLIKLLPYSSNLTKENAHRLKKFVGIFFGKGDMILGNKSKPIFNDQMVV